MKERLIDYWESSGIIKDKRVIKAFRAVPREKFINKGDLDEAYGDHPLSIGFGQTISQPTTVMMMTEALELRGGEKVLEIGAGSGYQAAIISKIVGKKGRVITTEIIPELAKFARKNIKKLNMDNVEVVNYDGSQGYKKKAPYDRIIATAACPKVPKPLLEQLNDRGILVAPVGSIVFGQSMLKIRKEGKDFKKENLGDFVFVPLKGKYGFN